MDDHFHRLLWALPLVILIGVGALLILKRLGLGQNPASVPASPCTVIATTPISAHTTVLTVEVDGKRFVVFESTAHVSVQATEMFDSQASANTPWRRRGRST